MAPLGAGNVFDSVKNCKLPHGRRIWSCRSHGPRTTPLRSPHVLITGCLRYLNPYGARKLKMHALKPYGPVREVKILMVLHGPYKGPVLGSAVFVQTALEQPRNSPYGTWECDVTGAFIKYLHHMCRSDTCRFHIHMC